MTASALAAESPAACPATHPFFDSREGVPGAFEVTHVECDYRSDGDLPRAARSLDEYDDGELLNLWANERCERAFAILYERYSGKLSGFLRCKYHLDAHSIEDVVQQAWMEVFRCHAQLRGLFADWFFFIVRNRAIDYLRRKKRADEVERPLPINWGMSEPAYREQPIDAAMNSEQDVRLSHAVATLPEPKRLAIEHVYYRERRLSEAATTLGITARSLCLRLRKAKESLSFAMA